MGVFNVYFFQRFKSHLFENSFHSFSKSLNWITISLTTKKEENLSLINDTCIKQNKRIAQLVRSVSYWLELVRLSSISFETIRGGNNVVPFSLSRSDCPNLHKRWKLRSLSVGFFNVAGAVTYVLYLRPSMIFVACFSTALRLSLK